MRSLRTQERGAGMWLPLVVTVSLALGVSPCVLQRACRAPRRAPPPPAAVCMHRVHTKHYKQDHISIQFSGRGQRDARAHIWSDAAMRARVLVQTLLRLPLAAVLLLLPLCLPQGDDMKCLLLTFVLTVLHQVSAECKNCVTLGKEEKAMFRAHSEACLPQSRVEPKLVESLLNGQLVDDPRLRSHVYCILLKCKVVGKDGKLQKAALLGKMSKNATKVLESCLEQKGDSPEELAWNLFRCGYDKKAVLFEYMPIGGVDN